MREDVIHAAEAWVWDKIHTESFQTNDDWVNWIYEGVDYDINIFVDFHTGKLGATLYPLRKWEGKGLMTDTLKGVRIL
jgi:hypothetical protein